MLAETSPRFKSRLQCACGRKNTCREYSDAEREHSCKVLRRAMGLHMLAIRTFRAGYGTPHAGYTNIQSGLWDSTCWLYEHSERAMGLHMLAIRTFRAGYGTPHAGYTNIQSGLWDSTCWLYEHSERAMAIKPLEETQKRVTRLHVCVCL